MNLTKGNELTTENVAKFIGGDLEVANPGDEHIFRGPIKTAVIKDGVLRVERDWTTRGLHYPPEAKDWTRANNLPYEASLDNTAVTENEDNKLVISAAAAGESITFYASGNNLDPKKVSYLKLTRAE